MFTKKNILRVIGKENYLEWYQTYCRIYLDEYQSNKPEVETDNFFYSRFLKRK